MNQIELAYRAQKRLSNFNGMENYEGIQYSGQDDDFLHFDGAAQDFSNEEASNLSFSMTLSNIGSKAKDRVIALCPGYFAHAKDIKDERGNPVDAIVSDGNFITDENAVVSGKGRPKLINNFLSFVRYNPLRIIGLRMSVNNPCQLKENLYIRKLSPFQKSKDYIITTSIPFGNFQLDNQTVLFITLKAGCNITLNFFAGAILNTATALDVKAKRALNGYHREFF